MKRQIHMKHIHSDYKGMLFVSRGATSIVLAESEKSEKVLMITVDPIKADWLIASGIGNLIREYEQYGKYFYVFELDRLFPLDKENTRVYRKDIKESENIVNGDNISEVVNYLQEGNIFYGFFDFASNYDNKQLCFDAHKKNVMQDKNRKIIVVDPVISREVLELCWEH